MERRNILLVWIGIIAYWLSFILEIAADFWFGSMFPSYNWQQQSISYLGQNGSPVLLWVKLWGVGFSLLLLLFSMGFYQAFKAHKWTFLATVFLIVYALGEGIGSGLFPINPSNSSMTTDAWLHNIFGGIGDTGIVLFPFMLLRIFSKEENHGLYIYLWTVIFMGILMASFFLIAKYFQPGNFILYYKGVWQRIYLFNYHCLLLVVSFKMRKYKFICRNIWGR